MNSGFKIIFLFIKKKLRIATSQSSEKKYVYFTNCKAYNY